MLGKSLNSLRELLKPAPATSQIEDPKVLESSYAYWRLRMFYSIFIGYALFYFSRNGIYTAMPVLMADLGYSKQDLGVLLSLTPIIYGASKFVSGIIGDRSNPRFMMGIGLILTGITNIFFGMSSSLFLFCVFMGINSFFQGWGWPPCARVLTHWYSTTERGTKWSIWSTSHNVGGLLIPILVAFCAYRYGWRVAMFVPGIICILGGFWIMNRLRDTPQSVGLPSIENYKDAPEGAPKVASEDEAELSVKEILFQYIFPNKYIWILAVAYFFVYVVRTGLTTWTIPFLTEEKGYSLMGGGGMVSLFEAGGIAGMLLAGWISDTVFSGRRGPVMILYMAAITVPVAAMWIVDSAHMSLIHSVAMTACGFLIFGPQMLVGVCAADLSHKKAAATATGFVGYFAYMGAAAAGWLGMVAEQYGWDYVFMIYIGSSIMTMLLLIPLWNAGFNRKKKLSEPVSQEKQASPA